MDLLSGNEPFQRFLKTVFEFLKQSNVAFKPWASTIVGSGNCGGKIAIGCVREPTRN